MLNKIRCRARPRFFKPTLMAAKYQFSSSFCVVFAVCLLLFSVSLLHSKLGSEAPVRASSNHPTTGRSGKQTIGTKNLDLTGTHSDKKLKLREDEDMDEETGSNKNENERERENFDGFDEEDKIDEFDTVEEDEEADSRKRDRLIRESHDNDQVQTEIGRQDENGFETRIKGEKIGTQNNRVEVIDAEHGVSNSELNSEFKSAKEKTEVLRTLKGGLFWDHVMGVARKPFLKRGSRMLGTRLRANEEFFADDSSEDGISDKGAFSSDDEPVDENVRIGLEKVKAIEDALLLKTSERVSPLRNGWGPWFDNVQRRSSKSEFSKRDRVVRTTADLLNPMNNPLLQDPDAVFPSGLTKSDKAIQKALRRASIEGLPFVAGMSHSGSVKEEDEARIELKRDAEKAKALEKTPDESNLDGGDEASLKETVNVDNDEDGAAKGGLQAEQSQRRNNDEIVLGDKEHVERKTTKGAIRMLRGGSAGLGDSAKDKSLQNAPKSYGKQNIVYADLMVKPQGEKQGGDPESGTSKRLLSIPAPTEESSSHHAADQTMAIRGFNSVQGSTKSNSASGKNLRRKKPIRRRDFQKWGYFPGLDPFLSFSEFMEEFFEKGNCSLRVFMAWTTPSWTYTVRHRRGLESLLHLHPDACVAVLSDSMEEDFFIDFVKAGYSVAVVMPNLDELLFNTPADIFASLWLDWKNADLYYIHYTELLRLAALYKYGGIYLDSDVIVLKPLDSLSNTLGMESSQDGHLNLNGAVMIFEKNSSFLLACLKEFTATYDDALLKWNGAELLSRVAHKTFSIAGAETVQIQHQLVFFPLNSKNVLRYFTAPESDYVQEMQDMLVGKILNESYTLHFWNGVTSRFVPEPGSLVERIINSYCLYCSDLL